MYLIIASFLLVILLGTTTYAFFNYTRTGTANVIRTGRIAFNSTQGTAITLTDLFPIDVSQGIPDDNTKVGTLTVNVTGDTEYTGGIEYLVTAVNVQNTVGSKNLPISIDVSVASNTENSPATTLGTADDDYFTDRGSTTSYYKVLATDVIENNEQLVVGYIAPGQSGVDGNIVIKAYLDADKIAISDTYYENATVTPTPTAPNDMYGTTTEWVDDRVVLTTTEWNSLQTSGVSFQIKVEAQEDTWVPAPVVTATFDTGRVVNTKVKLLANFSGAEYTNQDYSEEDYNIYITSFEKSSTAPTTTGFNTTNVISSSTSERPIYIWKEGTVVKWYTDAEEVYLSADSSYLLNSLYINSLSNSGFGSLNTSNVTNMSYMFAYNYSFTSTSAFSIFTNWNVSNVTDMSHMFEHCLQEADLGTSMAALNGWDIGNVTNFTNMFKYSQGDRSNIVTGSSIYDLTFPTFTSRPGTWDNQIIEAQNEVRAGTFVSSN